MNVTAQKFQSSYALVGKPLAWSNHRTTLPQSRPIGRDSSLREGAGNGCVPFNRVLAKIVGWRAIFIAPTKLREFCISPFNRVLAKPQAQRIFIFFSGVFYDSNLFSLPWGYASVLL